MTSTDGLELTSTINTGLPWKMVAKGSRSSTRRNKKRVAASDVEAVHKSAASAAVESVSESEKLGVAVLGGHFAEKVEHVPIKKRRFMVCSPSQSNWSSSRHEGLEHRAQINHALHVSRLNPNLIDERTSDVFSESSDCNDHDFSGIEILADVACSSDISSDKSTAWDHLSVEKPAQRQNPSTFVAHLEADGSSAITVAVSQKDSDHDSRGQSGEDKSEIVASQSNPVDILSHASYKKHIEERSRVASGEMVYQSIRVAASDESSTGKPKGNVEADEIENLASTDERIRKSKNIECPKDVRLHWDLNVSMDAWGQTCDAEDGTSRKGTESFAPLRTELVKSIKSHMDGVVASDDHANIPSTTGSKGETAARNTKEFQSGYDSQFEDGELREPYPCWEENEGDAGEVEQVDYGSEPDDESNESKLDDVDKEILTETKYGPVISESRDASRMAEATEGSDIEKHVVICLKDSPSKGFSSKLFKDLPSHDAMQRRRSDNYEELNERDAGSDKFVRRDRSGMHMSSRSPGRGPFSGWDSKRRLCPIYKGNSYRFGRPRPKSMVEGRGFMNGFDQPAPGPDGHLRRQFSGDAYRGRFRRYPDGGMDHDFRGMDRGFPGNVNEYPARMHYRNGCSRRERSNSPVFRRMHYPQPYRKSPSRSRSRSPVMWNNRNRSPGFRADERMERVRLPFQKRFPADQEMGFMSPPRNRMSPPRNSRFFEGRNNVTGESHHNNFRARKSPGRMFRSGQQFENGPSSMRRVDTESHQLRPMMRHRQLEGTGSHKSGGGRGRSRGCKYGGGGGEEDNGGNRYEMVSRPPRSHSNNNNTQEDGDNIRRFRFNGDHSLVVPNNKGS